jgi:hypothetical protein
MIRSRVQRSATLSTPDEGQWTFSPPRPDPPPKPVMSMSAEEWMFSPPRPDPPPKEVIAQALSRGVARRRTTTARSLAEGTPLDFKEPDYSDDVTPIDEPPREIVKLTAAPLEIRTILDIVREVARSDSGADTYSSIGIAQPEHGLTYGLVRVTQASGRLGSMLGLMQSRDAAAFSATFGPNAAELLAVTTAATAPGRLAPVGGEPLTSPAWLERFKAAGQVPAFQAAQNEEAVEGLFRPMLPVASALGMDTDRALAMVFDRVVTMGIGGGLRWIVAAAGPLQTARQRDYALQTLGHANLAAFQSQSGLTPNGLFTAETHTQLTGALRQQGLIPMPSAEELMARLLRASSGPSRQRLSALMASTAFQDIAVI